MVQEFSLFSVFKWIKEISKVYDRGRGREEEKGVGGGGVEVNVMRTDRSSRRELIGYTDRHRARRSNMDQWTKI